MRISDWSSDVGSSDRGFGFPGAGSNRAHNLPLEGSPRDDSEARAMFNAAAKALHVPPLDLEAARQLFTGHGRQGRVKERDNALATRPPAAPPLPRTDERRVGKRGASTCRSRVT